MIHTDSLRGVAVVWTHPAFADGAFPILHAFTDTVLNARPVPRTLVVTLGNVADQNLAVIAFELLEALTELRGLVANTMLMASSTSLVVGEYLLLLQVLRIGIRSCEPRTQCIIAHLIYVLGLRALRCSHISKNGSLSRGAKIHFTSTVDSSVQVGAYARHRIHWCPLEIWVSLCTLAVLVCCQENACEGFLLRICRHRKRIAKRLAEI